MADPLYLRMGVDSPPRTDEEQKSEVEILKATVEKYLPELCKALKEQEGKKEKTTCMLHQDAFAAGYNIDEYTLLGMAIKYAGLFGVPILIHGENHETF